MTQPTQDTDITSSISPLFYIQDDDFSDKVKARNNMKKLVPGRSPVLFTMETVYSNNQDSEIGAVAKYRDSESVKSLGEMYPWLVKFSKVVQSAVGSKNVKLLDRLLLVYIENMSRDVNTCHTKPHRAAKLKTHISKTLIFFHLYWKNIKERVEDHSQYLDKMSQILGMYVDMELKASRRGKDSACKIAARLITAMFIYLDNSLEHIFRILFRVKFITKNYSEICGPIFTKLFSGLSGSTKCITDITYTRYLLAFKLWKKINDDLRSKKKINELAVALLGQHSPALNPELAKIIPKPPDCHKNGTLWLLQPNSFDLRKACDAFVKYEVTGHILSLPESIERLKIMDNVDTTYQEINLKSSSETLQQRKDLHRIMIEKDAGTDVEIQLPEQTTKVEQLKKFKPSFPKLKPGEVVFIDLTAENDEQKQGKKKKRKDKKKLEWLKKVSKKSKPQKECRVTDKTWVEKADAYSTEVNNQEIKTSTINWPISDDEVSESTQQIRSTTLSVHKFGKLVNKLSTEAIGAKHDTIKCDTKCRGCKGCNLLRKPKYTTIVRRDYIESSEARVTSQTSLFNNTLTSMSNTCTKKEYYQQADSFRNTTSRNVCDYWLHTNLNDSGAYNSKTLSSNYSVDQIANHSEALKVLKREPHNIIYNSLTDINCDKIIFTDSDSFNINEEIEEGHLMKQNLSLPIGKLDVGDAMENNIATPTKISEKSMFHSPALCSKLSTVRERHNESCVVSTTASHIHYSAEEQINVISGSTHENFESNMNTKKNPRKLFPQTRSRNCYIDASGGPANNELQHNLIHALSLDEIIQIGRDDVDSQSENDEEINGTLDCSKKSITSYDYNGFFHTPQMKLYDDPTQGNEVQILETVGDGSKVDEFENIDILDSILNGDMSMKDILEEQHLCMTSTSNDTSENILGCCSEFFNESEVIPTDRKLCTSSEKSHVDEVAKFLPEGSLGTTGILNSLLDSDLTSIDSSPSDFMYSNVQTIDPRLIRKSPTADRVAFLGDFSTVSDLFLQKEQSSHESCWPIDSLAKKTKDQLFLDQKDSLSYRDLEELRLTSNKDTDYEMPMLEDELIQLPQQPLINETLITQTSPTPCESPVTSHCETDHLNNAKSTLQSCIGFQNFEKKHNDYSKLDDFREFTSLELKDVIQHSPLDTDHNEELPTSTLTDFTPPQSVDPPQSPYTFALSPAPAHNQPVQHSPTHSIGGTSRHPMCAHMLSPSPSVPQLNRQNNLTPPPTPQHSQNLHNENLNQEQTQKANTVIGNIQKNQDHYLPIGSQPYTCAIFSAEHTDAKDDSVGKQSSVPCIEKTKPYEAVRRRSHTRVICVSRSKNSTKMQANPMKFNDVDAATADQDTSLHLAEVRVAMTRLRGEEISAKASGEQSVLKSHNLVNREADIPFNIVQQALAVESAQSQSQAPQMQRIDFRKFSIAAQQKPVLINLNGKTKPALVLERNKQSDKVLETLQEDVRSSCRSDIVYKLTSNVNTPTSKDKPFSKLPKLNFTIRNEIGLVNRPQPTISRCDTDFKTSKETQKIARPRCSARRVKSQATKSTKELNTRKSFTTPITEEPSLKKRKTTSKILPLLENKGIAYSVNQQKSQEKHSNGIRRDFGRKDRTKTKVV